jgi:parallel beta helix pectate lyase-like protein
MRRIVMPTLRKPLVAFFALLTLAALNLLTARASGYWYASPTGDNSNDCQTTTTPCKTIQAAINKAPEGDYVVVMAGTYSVGSNGESFPITITKALNVGGDYSAPTRPIVDASNSGYEVFSAVGNIGIFMSNLTVQGGVHGIGFQGASNISRIWGELYDSTITLNDHNGIYSTYSNVAIKRTLIALNGSGGSLDSAIRNFLADGDIINNVIVWSNGHGVYNEVSSPNITNNTISLNYAGTGIANLSASNPQITNNIVALNGHHGIYADGGSAPTNTYNDVWANSLAGIGWADYYGTSGGTGSISRDPRLVSLLDFHLQCGSPAINAGNNSAPSVPSYDMDNNSRPVAGIIDMGAYEKQPPLFCLYLPLILK